MSFMRDKDKILKHSKSEIMEEQENLEKLRENTEFEKGDFLALVIAFIIAVLPVVLVILFLFYWISGYFFR